MHSLWIINFFCICKQAYMFTENIIVFFVLFPVLITVVIIISAAF